MHALPINVDDLVRGLIVEGERLEFKEGWNPEAALRTICAFANDVNNWGGGYLIIGLKEHKGQGVFPPAGLDPQNLDKYQKEILEMGYRIRPHYHPVVTHAVIEGKVLLILWCPGGDTRPYQAPEHLGKGARYSCYIRRNSSTVKAEEYELRKLYDLASQVPFDDRICHHAKIEDLD